MVSAVDNASLIGIILDVIVVLALVIAVLAGAKRGLLRMFKGLLSTILVLVVAFFAVSPVSTLITDRTTWDESLSASLTVSLSDSLKFENPNVLLQYRTEDEAVYNADGELIHGVVYEEGGVFHSVDELGSNFMQRTLINAIVKSRVQKYYEETENPSGRPLINTIANTLTIYIIMAGVFIVLAILLQIVVFILFKLLRKVVSSLYIAHFADRLLGAVLGAAIAAIVLYILIGVLKMLEQNAAMEPVNLGIQNSFITKFIYENNNLHTYLSSLSIFKTIDSAVGSLLGSSPG